ncbi:hypothetical protein [Synechococcus sp. A15-28]|nr:hypothetical protein [Synechococcus sp. A15-28]QNI42468.1 hypothetical protein SynA1528_01438 [Synechococcus sp. A15-28]
MTDDFCCEFATALAVMLMELNAELKDFEEQVDAGLTLELEQAC